jgi:hypothetical protein
MLIKCLLCYFYHDNSMFIKILLTCIFS